MSDGESTLSQAADAVEEASNHKVLDVLARAGFAVMALLHVILGAIAIAIAFGHPGEAGQPVGPGGHVGLRGGLPQPCLVAGQ